MKGFENSNYLLLYIISNAASLLFLWAAIRRPTMSRLLFFMLFLWASWTNWKTSSTSPEVYLEYADLAVLDVYREFIRGWFSQHLVLVVKLIAISQLLIAISMLFKGWLFRLGNGGGILFLLSIAPFGVGSAFPCTLILAVSMFIQFRHDTRSVFTGRTLSPRQGR